MDGQAVYDQEDRVVGAFEGCKQVTCNSLPRKETLSTSADAHGHTSHHARTHAHTHAHTPCTRTPRHPTIQTVTPIYLPILFLPQVLAAFAQCESADDLAAVRDGFRLCMASQLCPKEIESVTNTIKKVGAEDTLTSTTSAARKCRDWPVKTNNPS